MKRDAILKWTSCVKYVRKMILDAIDLLSGSLTYHKNKGEEVSREQSRGQS